MAELSLASARSLDELIDMVRTTRVNIRVTAGFVLTGREPAQVGEIITVSRGFAAELVACEKAEIVPDVPRVAAPKEDPNFMPQIETSAAPQQAAPVAEATPQATTPETPPDTSAAGKKK